MKVDIFNDDGQKEVLTLTQQQIDFANNYVDTNNSYTAAEIAGYSRANIAAMATKCLRTPHIIKYIKHLRRGMMHYNDMQPNEIISQLASCIRVDLSQLYDEEGKLIPVKQLPPEITKNIKEIQEDIITDRTGKVTNRTKIKMYSKEDAIEKMIKILGLYEMHNKQVAPSIDFTKLSDSALLELSEATLAQ